MVRQRVRRGLHLLRHKNGVPWFDRKSAALNDDDRAIRGDQVAPIDTQGQQLVGVMAKRAQDGQVGTIHVAERDRSVGAQQRDSSDRAGRVRYRSCWRSPAPTGSDHADAGDDSGRHDTRYSNDCGEPGDALVPAARGRLGIERGKLSTFDL
jgi:hypothetical protein